MAPAGYLNCGCTYEEALFEESLARHHIGSYIPSETVRMDPALRNPLLEFSERGDHLYPNIVSFTVLSSDMLIYCLLTIVYRVIPPPPPAHPLQFCDEAVQSARTALELLFKAAD